jgi:hypothetical protein
MIAALKLSRLASAAALLVAMSGCAGRYHLVWGDMHGHTRLSDGKGSLDDYFRHARDVAKLDFVIVTDHDFGHEAPWRMPQADWDLTQSKADEYTANGRFVAIAGYEWTSQEKYWTDVRTNLVSERLFQGPPRFYNHKNVYLPARVPHLFSAKDPAYTSPDLLAAAVRTAGGLIHNAHPDATAEGRDQFDYRPAAFDVIANTEMWPDLIRYRGTNYPMHGEQTVRGFLDGGGRTGFVGGSDTHDGKPAARTAVLVPALTRAAIFDALRRRRNYAVNHARIGLDFRINGHLMGEEVEVNGWPRIVVKVNGTAPIEEVILVRDGAVIHALQPGKQKVKLDYLDQCFGGSSYYYVRVTQSDRDEHGNKSCAWSSPIWVRQRRPLAWASGASISHGVLGRAESGVSTIPACSQPVRLPAPDCQRKEFPNDAEIEDSSEHEQVPREHPAAGEETHT